MRKLKFGGQEIRFTGTRAACRGAPKQDSCATHDIAVDTTFGAG